MFLEIQPSDAIIVVDMQNDFLPGGSLAVADADILVPIINKLMLRFDHRIFTRDWHPENHISFSDHPLFTDGSWPKHCVQNTPGAAFHPDLNQHSASLVVSKAQQPDQEAYSGFQYTNLTEWLNKRQIKRIFITGVATDFCVLNTALDSVKNGFETWVVKDAIKDINNPEGTAQQALNAMKDHGIKFTSSYQVTRS